jgi:hypothetical protein
MFYTYKINKKEIYISNHMMNGYYLFKSLLEIIFSIDLFCLLLSAIQSVYIYNFAQKPVIIS